ncbi:MAG: hypothetical protein WCN95_10815 [bacterium]
MMKANNAGMMTVMDEVALPSPMPDTITPEWLTKQLIGFKFELAAIVDQVLQRRLGDSTAGQPAEPSQEDWMERDARRRI